MEYNSERDHLVLKEYGRNVQKLVEYISTIEDKERRTAYAHTLINLMKMLNPSVKENSDNPQRIWDHLYVMADFKLEIDGPYPKPEPETIFQKPQPLEYKESEVKFRNYGRNIELLVAKAMEIEEEEEKLAAFIHIGRLVKTFYSSWHKDSIDDEVIIEQLKELSDGKIDLTEAMKNSKGSLFNSSDQASSSNSNRHSSHRGNGKSSSRGQSNRGRGRNSGSGNNNSRGRGRKN